MGVFTDGDLRRWLVKGNGLQDPLSPAITRYGYRLPEQWRAGERWKRCTNSISAAPVVDMDGVLVGRSSLHDLHRSRHRLIDAEAAIVSAPPVGNHFQSGLFSNCCLSSAFMSSSGLPSHWYLAYFFG